MFHRTSLSRRVGIFPIQLDPPTLAHIEMLETVKATFGLTHIVLVPHTKFAVTIPHSLHLAALAGLAVKATKHFSVDFAALEDPNARLPRVAELLRLNGNDSVLIHWHHDRSNIKSYDDTIEIGRHENILLQMMHSGSADEEQTTQCELSSRLCRVNLHRGSETRRLLFEGDVDPTTLVSPAVLKYLNTHNLYRDFRVTKTRASRNQRVATVQGHSYDFAPHVCFEGNIPRLEICFDPQNVKARALAAKLKDFEAGPGEEPDLIVPIGGDGYMMQTIRKNWSRFIPFFGVNAGHVGYLLNDAAHLDELITSPLKVYHTNMLYVKAQRVGPDGLVEHAELAFNDAWIERSSGQTALIDVTVNGEKRLSRARGDGMLVSTAAGSTAYAIALGASPLPVGASMIQLVGSNICSPARLKPVHLNLDVVVDLEPQDTFKRPCKGYVDGVDVGHVTKMSVRSSRVAGVQLAFSKSCDLQSKLYKLQFPTN